MVIESDSFVPDDYDIITIAGFAVPTRLIELDNYLVTPNGDGANDFLQIPELELSPNNRIRIFDRNGLKVFEKDNYTNEFTGFAFAACKVFILIISKANTIIATPLAKNTHKLMLVLYEKS